MAARKHSPKEVEVIEHEVLKYIVDDVSQIEIGRRLNITQQQVSYYKNKVLVKNKAQNIAEIETRRTEYDLRLQFHARCIRDLLESSDNATVKLQCLSQLLNTYKTRIGLHHLDKIAPINDNEDNWSEMDPQEMVGAFLSIFSEANPSDEKEVSIDNAAEFLRSFTTKGIQETGAEVPQNQIPGEAKAPPKLSQKEIHAKKRPRAAKPKAK